MCNTHMHTVTHMHAERCMCIHTCTHLDRDMGTCDTDMYVMDLGEQARTDVDTWKCGHTGTDVHAHPHAHAQSQALIGTCPWALTHTDTCMHEDKL